MGSNQIFLRISESSVVVVVVGDTDDSGLWAS